MRELIEFLSRMAAMLIVGFEVYREWLEHLPSAEPKTGKWLVPFVGIGLIVGVVLGFILEKK